MDPALHMQQRIAQGLNDVTLSLRSSFNSLVLGAATTPGAAGPTNNAAAQPNATANANNHATAAPSTATSANPSTNAPTTPAASTTTVGGATPSSPAQRNPSDDGVAANPVTTMSTGADVDLEKGLPEMEELRHRSSLQGGSSSIALDSDSHSHGTPAKSAASSSRGPPEAQHQRQTQGWEAERPPTGGTEATAETGAVADTAVQNEEETAMVLRQRRQQRAPLTLQTLPPEVLMLIIHQLNFGDIERLRRTSHFFHDFAAPRMVRALFGATELHRLLVSHCASCLIYDEGKSSLLLASIMHRDYPLCARCVDCAVAKRDERLVVGRKVTMGDGGGVWVCRWCGWPVLTDAALGHTQFHRECYGAYNDSLLFFFLLGWIQLGLGIVAAALAWTYYRDAITVYAPTITSFIMLWVCFAMLMFRGNRVRTYHWTLLVEMIMFCLWVLPVHYTISLYLIYDDLPRSTMACLIMFSLNLVFRLLNVLGNIILMCEYQRTNHYLPKRMIPFWRRITNPLADALIFWTYPQSVEQKYPPHWG
ncbi:hypothetical protein RB601_006979 [Gaeumannomyces tritici]